MHKVTLLALLILFVANAQSAPPPGHPSTSDAARALGLPVQGDLRYEGRVLQAIDSNSYTYIEVENSQGQRLWLAAPRITVSTNAEIRFGDGAMMNNFYSKKLERVFAQVLFVSGVEVTGPAP